MKKVASRQDFFGFEAAFILSKNGFLQLLETKDVLAYGWKWLDESLKPRVSK